MSAELIGVIVTGVGLAFTMIVTALGGLGWVVRRSDEQHEALRGEMHQGFDGLRSEISQLRTEMGEENRAIRSDMGELRKEVNEIHVSLARLEGPQITQPAS